MKHNKHDIFIVNDLKALRLISNLNEGNLFVHFVNARMKQDRIMKKLMKKEFYNLGGKFHVKL